MKLYYYAIHTEVNQECFVKNKLTSIIPKEYRLVIPKEKIVLSIKDKRLFYINRTMPEYIIMEATDSVLPPFVLDVVSDMKNTATFISEETNSGNVPAQIDKSEVSKFIRNNDKMFDVLSGNIDIIFGQYAGYSGRLLNIENDEASIEINNAIKNVIKLPVWYIGKEITKQGE